MKRKLISLAVTLCLCLGLVPMPALAGLSLFETTDPHSTPDTAMEIGDDNSYRCILLTDTEVDWYKITFSQDGQADFSLELTRPEDASLTLEVLAYAEDGTLKTLALSEPTDQHPDHRAQLQSLSVTSGVAYYLRVAGKTGRMSAIYELHARRLPGSSPAPAPSDVDPEASQPGQVTVLLRDGAESVALTHAPLIGEDKSVYLPLRETLTRFGFPDDAIGYDPAVPQERVAKHHFLDEPCGNVLYTATVELPAEYRHPDRYGFGGYHFDDSDGHISLFVRERMSPGNGIMAGPVAVDGVTYVPYPILEYIKAAYPGTLAGMNLTIQTPDYVVRQDTEINPYSPEEQGKATVERLAYFTVNHCFGEDPLQVSDFAGFIPDSVKDNWMRGEGEAGKRSVYNPICTYVLDNGMILEVPAKITRDYGGTVWLWKPDRSGGINLGVCYFDGLPWWSD